jgi:NADH dehydrogenase/NADH:ubiquinone oxidoreductase subunit G
MTDHIELSVDGHQVRVQEGATLLEAARQAGVEVPVLCYFAHTTSNGLCRMCVVEVEGVRNLVAACVTPVRPGAVVRTDSEAVLRVRRTLLEMLASSVDLSEAPDLQRLMSEYGAHPERFEAGERRQPEPIDDNPMFLRDYAKCVLCWRCVQVCAEDAQYAFAINFSGRGFHTQIATFFDRPMTATTCVFCGQCVGVCPTGALKGKREVLLEQGVSPEAIFQETRSPARRKTRSADKP